MCDRFTSLASLRTLGIALRMARGGGMVGRSKKEKKDWEAGKVNVKWTAKDGYYGCWDLREYHVSFVSVLQSVLHVRWQSRLDCACMIYSRTCQTVLALLKGKVLCIFSYRQTYQKCIILSLVFLSSFPLTVLLFLPGTFLWVFPSLVLRKERQPRWEHCKENGPNSLLEAIPHGQELSPVR